MLELKEPREQENQGQEKHLNHKPLKQPETTRSTKTTTATKRATGTTKTSLEPQ